MELPNKRKYRKRTKQWMSSDKIANMFCSYALKKFVGLKVLVSGKWRCGVKNSTCLILGVSNPCDGRGSVTCDT